MKLLKLVRVLFPPDKITFITTALEENGFFRMLFTPVEGTGKHSPSSFFACNSFPGSYLFPWIQLEMVVDYSRTDDLINTLVETCKTWGIDVHIHIIPVEKVIRIGNGEIPDDTPAGGSTGVVA